MTPIKDRWTTLPPMNTPRRQANVWVDGGLLYVCGGGRLLGCEAFDPEHGRRGTWTPSPLRLPGSPLSSMTHVAVVLVAGGSTNTAYALARQLQDFRAAEAEARPRRHDAARAVFGTEAPRLLRRSLVLLAPPPLSHFGQDVARLTQFCVSDDDQLLAVGGGYEQPTDAASLLQLPPVPWWRPDAKCHHRSVLSIRRAVLVILLACQRAQVNKAGNLGPSWPVLAIWCNHILCMLPAWPRRWLVP